MNTCPICGNPYDESLMCPHCSFEEHIPIFRSNKLDEFEEKRKEEHEAWWKKQQERINTLEKQFNNAVEESKRIEEGKAALIDKLKGLTCEFERIRDENNQLKEQNNRIKEENCHLKDEVDNKQQEINRLNDAISDLETKVPICYILQIEYDKVIDIYPIFKGKTIIGNNPQVVNSEINSCIINSGNPALQAEHLEISSVEDNLYLKSVEKSSWAIARNDNYAIPEKSYIIENAMKVFIGNIKLIFIIK